MTTTRTESGTVFEPASADRAREHVSLSPPRAIVRERTDSIFVLGLYLVLLAVTRTLNQADTPYYALDIVNAVHGQTAALWEFGHALWRPTGYTILRGLVALDAGIARDDHTIFVTAVRVLTGMAAVAGAAAVVLFRLWLRRLGVPRLAAAAATIAFTSAAAFLGYAQTGSAYVPALAMLLLGFYALAAADGHPSLAMIVTASIAFAGAVLLWVPMVLGVPGAALSMIVLRGPDRARLRAALLACVLSGGLTLLVYLAIIVAAGLHSVHDVRLWMASASHGIVGTGGLPRAVVGFARSIVDTGQLGLVVKRHLIHDPYNPTGWSDILRAGLAILVLFYVTLGAMCLALALQSRGRRVLLFAACSALPVCAFALQWQGGDLERYLACFPPLFAAAAYAMALLPGHWFVVAPAAIGALCMVNARAISRSAADRECSVLTNRLASVPRAAAAPTLVISPHQLDEITKIVEWCPTSPMVRADNSPQVNGLVMANNVQSYDWRSWLATQANRIWNAGGRVWISRRAFAPAPAADWKWAEGDDPRLRWRDFPEYFKQLDVGPPVGGEDGFVEMLPTDRTREFIAANAVAKQVGNTQR